jgi:hypothetical protein
MSTAADQRADQAESMLPLAAELATMVHGDGGPEDVAQLLDGLEPHDVTALVVVLAGLVEPDRSLGVLLGWLDFDEHGSRVEPDWDNRTTLRQIADERLAERCSGDIPDEVAVDRFLAGEPIRLTADERLHIIVTARAANPPRPWAEIDALLGHKSGSGAGYRAWLRARRAANARGKTIEGTTAPQERLTAEQVVAIRERAQDTPLPALAVETGMQLRALRNLVQGKTYRDAGGPVSTSARATSRSDATTAA